ncbi:MAG: zinc-ribbon domain containing protein [Dehalococcoidia bacterium]|nr:zinc-ribbon domain containing protein [Dehalococcoidia bacterium]
MSFEDKTLQCSDCSNSFTFTSGEQEFFASKGYTNEPKRCPTCRQARKSGDGDERRGPRTMVSAICSECGQATEVPFQPREDRPVYCITCYAKTKLGKSR